MSDRNEPGLLQGKGQGMGLHVELMHPLWSGCVSCTISSLAAKFCSQQLSARKIKGSLMCISPLAVVEIYMLQYVWEGEYMLHSGLWGCHPRG